MYEKRPACFQLIRSISPAYFPISIASLKVQNASQWENCILPTLHPHSDVFWLQLFPSCGETCLHTVGLAASSVPPPRTPAPLSLSLNPRSPRIRIQDFTLRQLITVISGISLSHRRRHWNLNGEKREDILVPASPNTGQRYFPVIS